MVMVIQSQAQLRREWEAENTPDIDFRPTARKLAPYQARIPFLIKMMGLQRLGRNLVNNGLDYIGFGLFAIAMDTAITLVAKNLE